MANFEIEINGEPLPTMNGESGAMVVSIASNRGPHPDGGIYEHTIMIRRNLTKGLDPPNLPNIQLSVGDEVRIRIV